MKIFFGDLVHTWEKISVWTVPLNIGLVASYCKAHVSAEIEVSLFKHPTVLIEEIKKQKPDVVALSYYAWNTNLNNVVFKIAKEENPRVLTVGGGPTFTPLNANAEGGRRFFTDQPYCDVYTLYQGEKGFAELIRAYAVSECDLKVLKRHPVAGNIINAGDTVIVGEHLSPLKSIDDIPSPYLTGLLDPFLKNKYVPLLETNRNCPYRCAYCAFGVGEKELRKFDIKRVYDEIEYIAKNTTAGYLITTDTNFGILERDADIAQKIYDQHIKIGFPDYLCVVWNKSNPERVFQTARNFHGLVQVGASMQSLDDTVLSLIKRKNLPLESVSAMKDKLQSIETKLFSELITGLPGQTFESHINDNRKLMDLDAEVFNYFLRFLPGTEIDSKEMRSKFYHATGWRLQDDAFGFYNGTLVFEGEEMVLESTTMTNQKLKDLRVIHFLLQLMWGKKAFFDLLKFFQGLRCHPVDVICNLADAFKNSSGLMGDIYKRFEGDYQLEKFPTYKAMCDYWSREENLARLKSGKCGKLNSIYSFEMLQHLDPFVELIHEVGTAMIVALGRPDSDLLIEQFDELLEFSKELYISNVIEVLSDKAGKKTKLFSINIVKWRDQGYNNEILNDYRKNNFNNVFFVKEEQKARLRKQFNFFKHPNEAITLKKMFDLNPYDFFFQCGVQ
jgi:radical SAM superfamily enzyme YgiQ (UPF0313 family)